MKNKREYLYMGSAKGVEVSKLHMMSWTKKLTFLFSKLIYDS